MKIDLTNREYLWILKTKANEQKEIVANPMWKSVYRRLAEVVCELDAYIARSTECIHTKIIKEGVEIK